MSGIHRNETPWQEPARNAGRISLRDWRYISARADLARMEKDARRLLTVLDKRSEQNAKRYVLDGLEIKERSANAPPIPREKSQGFGPGQVKVRPGSQTNGGRGKGRCRE